MKRTQSWVGFQTDAATHDFLREIAEAEARSTSSLIRKIVADWCAARRQAPQQRRREKRQPEASATL